MRITTVADSTQSVEGIIPYLEGLYPGTPIGIINTDKLLELTIEGKTDAEMTAIINNLRVRFPLAF